MSGSILRTITYYRRRARRDLPRYIRHDVRADALSGLTVAVMGVPQAMAYAVIADLPPVYGLYTAIATCVVAALLGSSRHLVTGPTNASCMVLFTLIAPVAFERGADPIEVVLLLSFLTGVVQLAFGLMRLGGLVRYVSNSVMVGFTAGAGILIAANQIRNILGVQLPPSELEHFHRILFATLRHVPETNPYALVIGALTVAVAILAPRLHRRLPGALLAVAVTTALAWILDWHHPSMGDRQVSIVRHIEPIRGNLLEMLRIPRLLFPPDLPLVGRLGTGALALAILGLIEGSSAARAVAASSGQRLDFSRQFAAQGAANITGAFFSCFVGSGSFTRTAVCYQSGGRTRMAAVFSAVWTALTVVFLAPLANLIPKASLAGILLVIAYSMVDKHRLRLTWRTATASRIVLFGTLAATLVMPLQYAIFVGVFLSILILLRITGKVDLTHLVARPDSGFDEVPFNRAPPSPVVTINMAGDLYFAAVEDLDHELLRCLNPRTRVVVLRMKRLRAVGSTAMAILEHFWELLRRRDIRLVVCGIGEDLKKVMTGSGLREEIGEQNIFYADNKLFQSTELAHARAWSIVEKELRQAGEGEAPASDRECRGATAADLLSLRAIRFGNQHQLREAVWLVSEMQKHLGAATPPTVFLQDREGRLWGELTIWRLMEEIRRDLAPEESASADDEALRLPLRRHFTDTIEGLARTDVYRARPETCLGELLLMAVREDSPVLPVCGEHGRLIGLIESRDLVRGLARALGVTEEEADGRA